MLHKVAGTCNHFHTKDPILALYRYDVLILHAAEQAEFAHEVATALEQQHIRVCLKDRDLVGE